jgi:hypothetical protein
MVNSDEAETKIASIPPFGLRMQPALKRRIEGAAKGNGRSLNSEIVARLEQSFREEGGSALDLEKRVEKLEDVWVNMMFDERLDTMAKRLSALENRQSEQST